MKTKRSNIVIWDNWTSFCNASLINNTLIPALKSDKCDLHIVSSRPEGIKVAPGISIYPSNSSAIISHTCNKVSEIVHSSNAECLIFLGDYCSFLGLKFEWSKLKQSKRLIAYISIDGELKKLEAVEDFVELDELVVLNPSIFRQLNRLFAKYTKKTNSFSPPKLSYIPAAIDMEKSSFGSRNVAKTLSFDKLLKPQEAIYILYADLLSESNNFLLGLKSYAKAVPYLNKKTYLVICSAFKDYGELGVLWKHVEHLGLSSKVLVFSYDRLESNKEIRLLYQACEIGISTSLGESWGMATFHHALTGAAQILPNHSSFRALWRRNATLVNIKRRFYLNKSNLLLGEIDVEDLVSHIIRHVNEGAFLEAMRIKAQKNAKKRAFQIKNVIPLWKALSGSSQLANT